MIYNGIIQYGLIAEEAEEVLPQTNGLGHFLWYDEEKDEDGNNTGNKILSGIDYRMFVIPLIKAVQELSAKVEALEAQVSGSS